MKAQWKFWNNSFIATILTDEPALTQTIKIEPKVDAPEATPLQQDLAKSIFEFNHNGMHVQRINFHINGMDLILKYRRDERPTDWQTLKESIEVVFKEKCGIAIEN